jgi:hypothetical protein
MTTRSAFGPNLRRIRLHRDVSLDMIARATNVPAPLWEAFEENDLHGWPSGVLARAFVAEYARLIGEDADETVNQFCRLFPEGDRRRSHTIRDVTRLLDQPLVWSDHWPAPQERRADPIGAAQRQQQERAHARTERIAAACVDLAVITIAGATVSIVKGSPIGTDILTSGVIYYLLSAGTGWSVSRALTSWAAPRTRRHTDVPSGLSTHPARGKYEGARLI